MYYSLRQKKQTQSNRNKSIRYLLFTIFSAVVIFFAGAKALVYVINFIGNLKNSDTISKSEDKIPPNIPLVNDIPDYTNKDNIEVKGSAEAASAVTLSLNRDTYEQVADSDGSYIFKAKLVSGINSFFLFSTDSAGNESVHTKQYQIVLDKDNPNLTVNQPQDNSTVYGDKNRLVEIKGTSDSDVELKINDKYVLVSDDDTFGYKYNLQPGANTITLVAKDKAGNEATKQLTVNFQE
ncbi:MAG: hypothetical protein UT39_C0006G0021 [Candidatus Woesebacteria bacterium GW2011_GWA1_39_21]|uniref:Uncharacterized protein n=1 Tax=Candidatus Woesebacteria bacterium GW2011_GWA1_39_21 TaxID=1618550 RepID=A0A0G0QM97_9BACT|nr:MAG: hypothetical protein UT39_C0006G0021 [Candidatus Woesebacteria bacterium GW2011_GWA1_39_21]